MLITPYNRGIYATRAVPSGITEIPILNFDDWDEVHDLTWLNAQSAGTYQVAYAKSDVGNQAPLVTLDATGGIAGSKALRISPQVGSNRLPGMWFFRQRATGTGSNAGPSSDDGWMVMPRTDGIKALRFRVKYDTGYRIAKAALTPADYPNYRNFDVGTYCCTPATMATGGHESNNWHFYHYLWLRHDLLDGDWFDVYITAHPNHQRTGAGFNGGEVSPDPTLYQPSGAPLGDYFSYMTRVYLDADGPLYNGDPEISLPYSMWVDSISAIVKETPIHLTIAPVDYTEGQPYVVVGGSSTRDFTFDVTNVSGSSLTARVVATGHYTLGQTLTQGASTITLGAAVTWAAAETKRFVLTIDPDVGSPVGFGTTGVYFMPSSEYEADATNSPTQYRNRSHSSPYVENRFALYRGRWDAEGWASTMVYITPS